MIYYRTDPRNRMILDIYHNGKMKAAIMPVYDAVRDGYLLQLSGAGYKATDSQYVCFHREGTFKLFENVDRALKHVQEVYGR